MMDESQSQLQRVANNEVVPLFLFEIIVLILIILITIFNPVSSYYQKGVNATIHNQTFINSIRAEDATIINNNLIQQLLNSNKYAGQPYATIPLSYNNKTINLVCRPG